jgi:hypothetical protein
MNDENLEGKDMCVTLINDPLCRTCEKELFPNTVLHRCEFANIDRDDIFKCSECDHFRYFKGQVDCTFELPIRIQCNC